MKTLVVIPAYNEAENLERVVTDLREHCPWADYVIVNDGSTDDTVKLCNRLSFTYVNLLSNLGFSGAVQTGYKYAVENDYDIAVQFDGDGQHPAASIRELAALIEADEADYVIGSRYISEKKPVNLRMIGSRFIGFLIRLRTGLKIADPTSGMRAMKGEVLKNMAQRLNFVAEPDTLVRAALTGARIREIQVSMRERGAGSSHFKNPLNSLKYMSRMAISILFFQGRKW